MTGIQIFIVAFAVFAVVRAVSQLRRGRLTFAWFLFWFLFWGAVTVAVLLPQTTDIAARLAGVGRGADLVLYLSIVALFYLVFRLFVKVEETEKEITKLVRMLAIQKKEEQE